MSNKLLIGMLVAGLLALVVLQYKACQQTRMIEDGFKKYMYAMADTVAYYKDDNNTLHTRIATLAVTNTKFFLETVSKDSTIIGLQKLVKTHEKSLSKIGSSATQFETTTSLSSTTKTDTNWAVQEVRMYTKYGPLYNPEVPAPSPITIPIYKTSKSNEWISYKIKATIDSTTLDLTVKNKYSLVLGEEKGRLFADITNENPYDSVKTIRSFQVTVPPEKKWAFGLQLGGGINLTNIKPAFYIGLGIQKTLFKF